MESLERKLKDILGEGKTHQACPGLEELGGLLDGNLEKEQRERIIAHLAECARCRELVMLAEEIEEEREPLALNKELEWAKTLFKPSFFQRIWAGIQKILRREGGGDFIPRLSLALAVRGKSVSLSSPVTSYIKTLGRYQVEIEVERVNQNRYQVIVFVYDNETRRLVSGIRAGLANKRGELESLVVEQGKAVFEPVESGEYLVKFSEKGAFLGGILIRLKGEGKW